MSKLCIEGAQIKTNLKDRLRLHRNISQEKILGREFGAIFKTIGSENDLFLLFVFFSEYSPGLSFKFVLGPAPTHSITFMPSAEWKPKVKKKIAMSCETLKTVRHKEHSFTKPITKGRHRSILLSLTLCSPGIWKGFTY